MSKLRAGIVGASGYSGAVLTALLAQHPDVALSFCTSDKRVGERVDSQIAAPLGDLTFSPNSASRELAAGCDVVFLATPAEVSADLAPAIIGRTSRVIDLSGAFRLAPSDYPSWYGFEHPAPALLAEAHYGLPELTGAPSSGTRLVANPGCYATAALLALAPLLTAGLILPRGIIIDAKSGVTGAGRQAKEEYSFAEVAGNMRAYKLLRHQHTPEIARSLRRRGAEPQGDTQLTFTAHLLPIQRGILATCYARPAAGASPQRLAACLRDAYADTAFVRAVAPDEVTLGAVAGTNHARVGVAADEDVVIAIAAIDNLVKGAAGQAVQNMNLLFGLRETTALSHLARILP